MPADLSLADQVSRVAAHAAATRIDVLVNNAGFGTYGEFAGLDPGREHAEMMVNAVAAVDLAHAVLPGMLARRHGGIITVASSIALQPSPQQAVYGATKAFALAFSDALWAETPAAGSASSPYVPGRSPQGTSPASATRPPPPASSTGTPPTPPTSSGPACAASTTTR